MPKKTYKVGSDVYDIEESEASDFLKDFPNAKEVVSYKVDNDIYDIAVSDTSDFLKDFPNAKAMNPKGDASEGQPATSGSVSSGPIMPFGGNYSKGKKKESPYAVKPLSQEQVLKNKQDESATVSFEEASATPIDEYYQFRDFINEKREQVKNDPLAKKIRHDFEVYEERKQVGLPFEQKQNIDVAFTGVAEGKKKDAFTILQQDYLDLIPNEGLKQEEKAKIDYLRQKPEADLSEDEKKYLTDVNNKVLNGYAASRNARLFELDQEYSLTNYIDQVNNLNAQISGLEAKTKRIEYSDLPDSEKRVRLLEVQATYDRLKQKYDAAEKPPQEALDEAEKVVQDLNKVGIVSEYNMKLLGGEDRDFKADVLDRAKQQRSGASQFMDAVSSTLASSVLSITQAPKVIADLLGVGKGEYNGLDRFYDDIKGVKGDLQVQMGRASNFDDLPLYAKVPALLGEGVGSVAAIAGVAATLGGGTPGMFAASFLISEADYYQDAIDLGFSPQEAAAQATVLAAVTGLIETIVPDTQFFNPAKAGRSALRALRSGATKREAINLMLKELPASSMEYIGRFALNSSKEGGEEALSALGESTTKSAINSVVGEEVYKDNFNAKNIAEQTFTGLLTGGAFGASQRITANRRSPVQESVIGEASKRSADVSQAFEEGAIDEAEKNFADSATEKRAAFEQIPAFKSLSEEVKNHVISESLRADQIKENAKQAGVDEEVVAKELSEAKGNVIYALNTGKIKGDDSKNEQGISSEVGVGEAVVETEPNEGAGTAQVSASGNVQTNEEAVVAGVPESEMEVITADQESANEMEFVVVVDQVKATEPTLTEDEADHAAALVQEGESVEDAIKHVKENAPKEGDEVVLPPLTIGEKTYGMDRTMVFKDGVWQQKVGGIVTKVGESVQQQANDAFVGNEEVNEGVNTEIVQQPVAQTSEVEKTIPTVEVKTEEVVLPETTAPVANTKEENPVEGATVAETTESTSKPAPEKSTIFTEVDEAVETKGQEAISKRNALKAKYGDNYRKAIKITKDFEKIVQRLEKEGKITKKC
jgi:uncharacterized protein YidB (DUF937 family)